MTAEVKQSNEKTYQAAISASPRCLSLKQAATYLSAHLWFIRQLCWGGELPFIRAGRRWLIDRQDLDAWITRAKSKVA
jgi:excisionase family DNA binding protein